MINIIDVLLSGSAILVLVDHENHQLDKMVDQDVYIARQLYDVLSPAASIEEQIQTQQQQQVLEVSMIFMLYVFYVRHAVIRVFVSRKRLESSWSVICFVIVTVVVYPPPLNNCILSYSGQFMTHHN